MAEAGGGRLQRGAAPRARVVPARARARPARGPKRRRRRRARLAASWPGVSVSGSSVWNPTGARPRPPLQPRAAAAPSAPGRFQSSVQAARRAPRAAERSSRGGRKPQRPPLQPASGRRADDGAASSQGAAARTYRKQRSARPSQAGRCSGRLRLRAVAAAPPIMPQVPLPRPCPTHPSPHPPHPPQTAPKSQLPLPVTRGVSWHGRLLGGLHRRLQRPRPRAPHARHRALVRAHEGRAHGAGDGARHLPREPLLPLPVRWALSKASDRPARAEQPRRGAGGPPRRRRRARARWGPRASPGELRAGAGTRLPKGVPPPCHSRRP